MNKPQLVQAVSGASGADRRQVESVLDAFFDTIREECKQGEKVSWPGFGSFSVSQRQARTGRNPQTGAAVKIPASRAMKFSASSTLKEFLNARGGAGKKAAPAKRAGAAGKAAKSKRR